MTTSDSTPVDASSARLRGDGVPKALLGVYAVVWLLTAIEPLYLQDWLLENVLVLVSVPILVLTYRRFRFSDVSYVLITVFLTLHAIGAHYTYSEVPLGNWLRDAWHLTRNHYDRVVHFGFGALLAQPFCELLVRFGGTRGGASRVLTVHVILAWSGFFELVEAVVSHVANPELGAAYNGAQGDIWDAQKDMSLALAGGVLWAMAASRSKEGRAR